MYSRTSMTRTQVSGFELSGRSIMHSYSHDPMTHKTQICCKNHNSSYRGKAVLSRKMNEILLSWRGTPVIPTYKPTDPVIPRFIFGIPSPARADTFNPESRRDFAFKIPNPELQWMENQDPKKPNGVHHIKQNIIIRYLLALHIDCVLYVYLCIRASNF